MQSHEVIKKAMDRTSPKLVAAEMNVSLSLVYKWAQAHDELGSGSRNPLDRVNELYQLTQEPALLQWLCRQAGGYFVRNPPSSCEQGFEVLPATSEILKQFSDLLQEISNAAADNSITDEESRQIRRIWDELKGYAEGFVNCCEEGDFDRLNPQDRRKRRP